MSVDNKQILLPRCSFVLSKINAMQKINRKYFLHKAALAIAAVASKPLMALERTTHKTQTRFRLIRHATVLVELAGKKILVDPMLSSKEALDPIPNAANSLRIPMVDLPFGDKVLAQLLQDIDAVLVTHTHRDHWDIAAQTQIPKTKLIICQPADLTKIKEQGFSNVVAVDQTWEWNQITIHRTNGQHGTGEVGKRMGTVSGFVIGHQQDKLYIAGDTIWCDDVKQAITEHQPSHIMVNGGGAQFLQGDPITMTTHDVLKLASFTQTPITVVHLETINHCYQRRKDFIEAITNQHLQKQIQVPNDGDWKTI